MMARSPNMLLVATALVGLLYITFGMDISFDYDRNPGSWQQDHEIQAKVIQECQTKVVQECDCRQALPKPTEQQTIPQEVELAAPQSQNLVPKIVKMTMMYGDPNPAYERALQSHIAHGDLHNYPVKVLRRKMLGRLYTKLAWLLTVVLDELVKPPEERIEWIFWFDADTFVANPNVELEAFLPPPEYRHIHFLCGNDHNGLNDGAFLLRINTFAIHMLAAALSVESMRPEVDLRYSEQSAIEHVVNSNDVYQPWDGMRYIDSFAQIPQRWLNAYMGNRDNKGVRVSNKRAHSNSIKEGDFLLHFAGSGDTKRTRMTEFMDAWESNNTMWNLPMASTLYVKEVPKFWNEFAQVEASRRPQVSESEQTEAKMNADELPQQPEIRDLISG